MRTTFSCFLCVLLVAACWTQTTPKELMKTESALLRQAINLLNSLSKKDHDIFLHSPTNSIKECCSESALQCFKDELKSMSKYKYEPEERKNLNKLVRNLSKHIIMKSVKTCTNEDIKKVVCMSCSSYPKVTSKEFLINLRTLLQKANSLL